MLQNLGGLLPYTKTDLSNSIKDSDISPIAAIAYSKLTLANSIGNADIAVGAGIQYSKLLFTESSGIINTDINNSAAIAYGKLNLSGSIVNSDINAGAAIQYSKLNLTGGLTDSDINPAAAITWTKVNKFGSHLDDIGDVTISSPPAIGDVPTWTGTSWENAPPPGAGGGEANTIANIGTAGVGLYKEKVGTELRLKNINAGSAKITVTDDTIGNEVDIDVASNVVSTIQANTFGDFAQQFRSGKLELRDSNDSHSYVITGSDILGTRNVIIPTLDDHDTIDMVGTAQVITGTKTFVSSGLRIKDSDGSHVYTIISSDLTGDAFLTLPLFAGTDTLVTQGLAQPITNKTIDASLNSITNIGDANIGIHTSSKITIAAKGQLNTNIVYNDQANSYNAAFDQFFPSSRLLVGSSDGSQSYAIAGSAIAAPRTITLPLLTGPDTFVTQAFGQPITNKTINIDSNTIKHSTTNAAGDILVSDGAKYDRLAKGSANQVLAVNSGGTGLTWAPSGGPGGGEANTASNVGTAGVGIFKVKSDVDLQFKKINAGSTKVTITDDTTNSEVDIDLGSQVVATDQANTYGAVNQKFPSGRLLLGDLDGLQSYTFVGSNLAADRVVTWPLLGGNDTVVLEAHTQELTHKTINADAAVSFNTISNIGDGSIAAHTSTKITITDPAHLPSNILYTDTTQTVSGSKTWGTNAQIFRDNVLRISNPANTFNYVFRTGAITTINKNVTIPFIGNDDTFAMLGVNNVFNATQTINKTSGTTTYESLQQWYVSDCPTADGYVELVNNSNVDAVFQPRFNFKSSTNGAVRLNTYCSAANDTGNTAVLALDMARDADANITTRPLLQVRNNAAIKFTVNADGSLLVPDTITVAHAGGGAEVMQKWYTTDAASTDGYIEFTNATNTGGLFRPKINMRSSDAAAPRIEGYCSAAQDTGANPLIAIDGAQDGDLTITTRPLFAVRNNASTKFTVGPTGNLTIVDGADIILGATNGTTIGTATTQKIAFYGATPVARQASIADISTSATGTQIAAAVNAIITRLEVLGLIATV